MVLKKTKILSIFLGLLFWATAFPASTKAADWQFSNHVDDIVPRYNNNIWGDWGGFWEWDFTTPSWLWLQYKFYIKLGISPPVSDYRFPVETYVEYQPEEMWPGNKVRVNVFFKPYNKSGLQEIDERVGFTLDPKLSSRSKRPCVSSWWPPKFTCWTPWISIAPPYMPNLEVDMHDEAFIAPMKGQEKKYESEQMSGVNVDFAGVDALSLGVSTRTNIKFSDGGYTGNLYFIPESEIQNYDNHGSRSFDTRESGWNFSTDKSYIHKTYEFTVPQNISPGQDMAILLTDIRYASDFWYHVGLFPSVSIIPMPEDIPIVNKTVNLETGRASKKAAFYGIRVVYPPNDPPVAEAGPDQTGRLNESITLNAAGSHDVDGDIKNYTWKIGDYTRSTSFESIELLLADNTFQPGEYTASLTVRDEQDETATDTFKLTVLDIIRKPDIDSGWGSINVDGQIQQGNAFNVKYNICNRGNGVAAGFQNGMRYRKLDANNNPIGNWSAPNEKWVSTLDALDCIEKFWSFTIDEPGRYELGLILDDKHGLDEWDETNNEDDRRITIHEQPNEPPVPVITIDDDHQKDWQGSFYYNVGSEVVMNADRSYDDKDIAGIRWAFGDGGDWVTGSSVRHAYSGSGTYWVTLAVEDSDGITRDVSTQIPVFPPKPEFLQREFIPTYNSIKLKWTIQEDTNLNQFKLINITDNKVVWIGGNEREYTFQDLQPGTSYDFELTALSDNGQSNASPATEDYSTLEARPNLVPLRDFAAERQELMGLNAGIGGNNAGGGGGIGLLPNDQQAGGQAQGNELDDNQFPDFGGGKLSTEFIYFRILNNGIATIPSDRKIQFRAHYTNKKTGVEERLQLDPPGEIEHEDGFSPGESATIKSSNPIEPIGNYEVCLDVDLNRYISEMDEDDNTVCFDYTSPAPDLTVGYDLLGMWGDAGMQAVVNQQTGGFGGASQNMNMGGNQAAGGNAGNNNEADIPQPEQDPDSELLKLPVKVGNHGTSTIMGSTTDGVKLPFKLKCQLTFEDYDTPIDCSGPEFIEKLSFGPGDFAYLMFTVKRDDIPDEATKGKMCVKVDSGNEVAELDETNNITCIDYQRGYPNIQVSTVNEDNPIIEEVIFAQPKIGFGGQSDQANGYEWQAAEGQNEEEPEEVIKKIQFQITNNGDVSITKAIKLSPWYSNDFTGESWGLIGPESIPGLERGEVKTLTYTFIWDLLPDTRYNFSLTADGDEKIEEINEKDNYVRIQYTSPPVPGEARAPAFEPPPADNQAGTTPDSPFYWAERLGEGIKLTFTRDEEKKAQLEMQYANERLAEAQVMVEKGKEKHVPKLLESYEKVMEKAKETIEKVEIRNSKGLIDQLVIATRTQKKALEKVSETAKENKGAISDALEKVKKEETDVLTKENELPQKIQMTIRKEMREMNEEFQEPPKEPEKPAEPADEEKDEEKQEEPEKLGCMDPLAENFDSSATKDDGSCTYPPEPVYGCTDPKAENFDPEATKDDGSCKYPPQEIPGCTNSQASNYNPKANKDDGSCDFEVKGCTDPKAENYNAKANKDDNSCKYEEIRGCTNPDATNYNPKANKDDGSCNVPVKGCTDWSATNYNPKATKDDGSCTYEIIKGCTDPKAENYNRNATKDDSSCTYPVTEVKGCTDSKATNYNSKANKDDGSCQYPPTDVYGCTDSEATNYNPSATKSDGSCEYEQEDVYGCTNAQASNYNPSATKNDGSCIIPGCTDPEAENYNSQATTDNGSCTYAEPVTDLSISPSDVTFAPTPVFADTTVQITARAHNSGETAVPAFQVAFYLDDTMVESKSAGPLNAGGAANVVFDYMPTEAMAGNHTVKIVLDPTYLITEENEGNNTVLKSMDVQVRQPDFVPSNFQVNPSGPASFSISVTVTNQGTEGHFGGLDVVLFVNGEYWMNHPLESLNAGQSVTLSDFFWEPFESGTYNLNVRVDPYSIVPESNEGNNQTNTVSKTVTVTE